MRHRLNAWDFGFLALMMLGIAAAVYHAVNGRYANALMAVAAAALGIIVLLIDQTTRPAPERLRLPQWRPWRDDAHAEHEGPTSRWLSGSILAGFSATVVMTMALVIAYLLAGYFGSESGGQISHWFWALRHGELTDGINRVPVAAFTINLIAGLIWAVIYARFVEPVLRGAGWWRGMVFSLAPWLLSLLVFFPIVGAGVLGISIGAGPLPAIGNLILHLIYGAVLGSVYGLSELSAVDEGLGEHEAKIENDGIAYGLVAGLASGIVVGAILSAFLTNSLNGAVNMMLAGAAFGTFIGGMAGPFLTVDRDIHRHSH